MATDTAIQLADRLKREARKFDAAIRDISSLLRRKWAELGEICCEFRDKELFKYTTKPFHRLEDWRADVGIARSTMYAAMRCYDALKKLPKKDRLALTRENAEWLAKLPESKRFDEKWITKAKELNEEEFSKAVNKALPGAAAVENRVWLKVRMYESARTFVEETMEEFAKNQGLKDDYGRALELICAEVRSDDKDQLIATLHRTLPAVLNELKAASELVQVTGTSAEETLDQVVKRVQNAVVIMQGLAFGKPQRKLRAAG